jgi:predicted metal-dependent HD superfamily phosphohydrolase
MSTSATETVTSTLDNESSSQQYLRHSWHSLVVDRLGASSSDSNHWFAIVSSRYNETWRHYHTLMHIHDLLQLAELHRHQLNSPAVVELSIWFHDVVYDPKSNDNEVESVKLFEQFCSQVSLPTSMVRDVTRFILCTIKHELDNSSSSNSEEEEQKIVNDLKYFLDFDVSVLARPRKG